MKSYFRKSFFAIILVVIFLSASSQNSFFRDAPESLMKTVLAKRAIVPEKYRTIALDTASWLSFSKVVPNEKSVFNRNIAPIIKLPMPDGVLASFRIWQSIEMEAGLSDNYPNFKTYTGQGIDDPTATIKLDWTSFGFHAMILSPVSGTIFIDPFDQKSLTNYISYYKVDLKKRGIYHELPPINISETRKPANILAHLCVGTQLRTYKLAIACTNEYAKAATGMISPTKADALAKIVTSVSRVNGVYERELSIRLVLVANNNNIIFVTNGTDLFTGNNDANILIDESQEVIDNIIGDANYDIGHTFSTGGGGLAGLGVVCKSLLKAKGITGSPNPVGDAYDIDYVAHEIGHQFGANHPFNSNLGSCGGGNAAFGANVEPGSGSTIMAYAGICGTDNLQNNSDPHFHGVSFDEIVAYSNLNSGNNCAVKTNTGNVAPVVNAGADFIIPINTPFLLTGSATDANGDALTYSWEQMDVNGDFGSWNTPVGNAPLFRSFTPSTSPIRYFPKLSTQINNTTEIGELLPTYNRTMNFRLTARDNKAGGSGVCNDQTAITVSSTGGPFVVTSPNNTGISWRVNEYQTVTWNIANTNLAPINCSNVKIELSTDGGLTFPITILANTPNDGSEEIIVPNNITPNARVRVMAVGNIFYDFSNNNFSIQAAPSATFVFNNPPNVLVCLANSGATTIRTSGLAGFNANIALAASLNPAGTTVTFGATTIATGGNTTVTLNNTGSLAAGIYTVRVTGISGSVTQTKDILFTVGAAPSAPTSLTTPANDAIGVSFKPSFAWSAVSGASSYLIEISKSNSFAVIAQSIAVNTASVTLTISLDEDNTYFWRVKSINSCGTGSPTAIANRFKTGKLVCTNSTVTSINVPRLINSINAVTVTSTLNIPINNGVTITDLNVVGLLGTHSFISDLTITLSSPNNTSVILFDGICGDAENFDITLDDQSAIVDFPCPPIGGVTVKPQGTLSGFNGQSSTGTWTLTVRDNSPNDGGSLTAWGLQIIACTLTATPLSVSTSYTFIGNGNWSVAANWQNSIIPPAVLPNGSTIIVNHIIGGQCRLDVTQQIANGATLNVLTGKNLLVPGVLTIQ